MGLIGSIIGGATSAVGGIMAGNALSSGYTEMKRMYDERLSEIKARRDAVYYQDPNASAENRAAVTNAQKVLAEQGRRSRAANIVTGGTDESEALAKQNAADAVGQMLQQQATQHEQRKMNAYDASDNQINAFAKYRADAALGAAQAKANATKEAFGGLSKAAGELPF